MYSRMYRGEDAAKTLNIFASCFCSPNSFHLNGDQCKAGYSNFTYDPFTLEGNFAFASAIQEMLLQSFVYKTMVETVMDTPWFWYI